MVKARAKANSTRVRRRPAYRSHITDKISRALGRLGLIPPKPRGADGFVDTVT